MLRQCPRRSVITVIWAILAAVGVPLWLCAAGILTLVARNRTLRKRPDNIPVRILRPGQKRWRPGHGIWVHDVFLFGNVWCDIRRDVRRFRRSRRFTPKP